MKCKKCNTEFQVLMFLGIIPEFLVCPECNTAYASDDEGNINAVATVIR
jgi:hypothetical protein